MRRDTSRPADGNAGLCNIAALLHIEFHPLVVPVKPFLVELFVLLIHHTPQAVGEVPLVAGAEGDEAAPQVAEYYYHR